MALHLVPPTPRDIGPNLVELSRCLRESTARPGSLDHNPCFSCRPPAARTRANRAPPPRRPQAPGRPASRDEPSWGPQRRSEPTQATVRRRRSGLAAAGGRQRNGAPSSRFLLCSPSSGLPVHSLSERSRGRPTLRTRPQDPQAPAPPRPSSMATTGSRGSSTATAFSPARTAAGSLSCSTPPRPRRTASRRVPARRAETDRDAAAAAERTSSQTLRSSRCWRKLEVRSSSATAVDCLVARPTAPRASPEILALWAS
jgi:hypothetical protein